MKKIVRYISGMLLMGFLAIGAASCSPDDFHSVDPSGIPVAADYESAIKVEVDQTTNNAYFEFTGAKGVYPIWIIDGKTYSTNHKIQRYYRKAGDYTVEVKLGNANGMSQGTLTKTFHVDKTVMNGFGGFVYDSDFNLWKKAKVGEPSYYYAPGWSQVADPSCSFDGDAYIIGLPQATTDQWQAQMFLTTDMALEAGKTYDGSIIFTSTQDHPHVTWKVCEDGNDENILYYNAALELKAGEPVCYWFSDMPCENGMPKVKFVFDFGGNAENTEITIENFVIKDHANDDGTVLPELPSTPEPVWVAVDSDENLWKNATVAEPSYYYAPGWSQIANPKMTFEGTSYVLEFPQATSEPWQNQFILPTDLSADTETAYDMRVTLKASNDIKGVTVKLVQTDEVDEDGNAIKHDGNYFFAEQVDLVADEETKFWRSTVKAPEAMQAISLVFDFGGNPDNTTVTVKDIILQKHKD